ncbi:MAG TPA: MerR family transcriptional regulator [Phototrophicaceae bacterium]|jgi:DNA-binding transcriptional MerR regulator|nr:MerR family transcriptional regulator [Phototrophicaceae bacterium]
MLKIGEFARLSQVSMKTLRHYDRLGLLRPSHIDRESGYRLYEMEQLATMMRIQALKDCGFALENIAQLLQTHDVKAIEALLAQRVAEQQQIVAEEQTRLQRLMARLNQFANMEQVPPYDVALKRTEPFTLIGKRRCVATPAEIGPFANEVCCQLVDGGIICMGPVIHLYYELTSLEEELDVFVGLPVMALLTHNADLQYERIAAGQQVACVLHRGDYDTIKNAYITLNTWFSTSGYRLVGPRMEIYHRSPAHTGDPSSYLTEIQYPIELTQP